MKDYLVQLKEKYSDLRPRVSKRYYEDRQNAVRILWSSDKKGNEPGKIKGLLKKVFG